MSELPVLFSEVAAAECGHCTPPSLFLPLKFPSGQVEACPECGQPAEPKGCWEDAGGGHLHFECYGTPTGVPQLVEGHYQTQAREHHHFDLDFVIWRPEP